MKAYILHGIKQPFEHTEMPLPVPSQQQLLIQIKAASLNRRDWWILQGQYAGLKFPITLGSDGAGIVVGAGRKSLENKWLGKAVMINPGINWGNKEAAAAEDFKILGLPDDGTFATHVLIDAAQVYAKPEHLSYEEAAAIPLSGLTAYRALFSKGGVKPGEKVLISGVGGGVASLALLWALHARAEVYVTSGTAWKIDRALELGAKAGFSYRDKDWAENLKKTSGGIDVVIDSALGDGFADYPSLCNPGGRIVFFGGTAGNIPELNGRKIFWKQLSILGTTMGSPKDFEAMLHFVKAHKIKPIIDEILPFDEIETAISKMGTSDQFGKIVLRW